MHKSIRLTVSLVVEGDRDAAADFAKETTQAVQDILTAGRWRHPTLKLTVKKISEDVNDDDQASASS